MNTRSVRPRQNECFGETSCYRCCLQLFMKIFDVVYDNPLKYFLQRLHFQPVHSSVWSSVTIHFAGYKLNQDQHLNSTLFFSVIKPE